MSISPKLRNLLEKADKKFAVREWDAAIKIYDKFIEQAPEELHYGAYYNRGLAKYSELQYPEAIEDFNWVIEFARGKPGFTEAVPTILSYRGRAYLAVANYPLAIQDLQVSINSGKNNDSDLYYDLGLAYASASTQNYPLATKAYQQAISLNSSHFKALINLGVLERDQSHHQIAINYFTQAIDITHSLGLKTEESVSYNNRGIAYFRLGESNDAIKDFDQAILLDPHNSVAHNDRGIVKQFANDFTGAIVDFRQAVTLDSKNSVYKDHLARVIALDEENLKQQVFVQLDNNQGFGSINNFSSRNLLWMSGSEEIGTTQNNALIRNLVIVIFLGLLLFKLGKYFNHKLGDLASRINISSFRENFFKQQQRPERNKDDSPLLLENNSPSLDKVSKPYIS